MNGVVIDVPCLAYHTWVIQIFDGEGERRIDLERDLREHLKEYQYSSDHKHVK